MTKKKKSPFQLVEQTCHTPSPQWKKHDSRKNNAPRPPSSCVLSLSEREGGGRKTEGGQTRKRVAEAVRRRARGGGSGRESTHMWQDHAALLVGREKYTNFKFQSHRLHCWRAQPQPTAVGYNCDGETGATSSKIKHSLPEKESKLNSLKVGTVF